MATPVQVVDATLRAAGIPILGVSMGSEADRLTWTVQFDPSATPAQRAQAAGILASVVTDATALHVQDQKDVKAFVDALPLIEQAIDLTILDQINVLRSKLPTPLVAITVGQWIQAVKNKVDTL